jgi:hypothetical protein
MQPTLSPAARLASELRYLSVLSAVQAGALAVYLDSTSSMHAPGSAMEKTYKVIKPVYNSVFYNCIKYSFAANATVLRRCTTAIIYVVSVLLSPPSQANIVLTALSYCDVALVPQTCAATAANGLSQVSP